MGQLRAPIPVKLFVGMLSPDPRLFQACAQGLTAEYGPIDLESALLPWDHTDYYRSEMGYPLVRKFFFFERLTDPGDLAKVKSVSLELETRYARHGAEGQRRLINLDPGYVTEAKVVLASTKDFSHRVYIGMGVYAEVTLRYDRDERAFQVLEHTYPDFRSAIVKVLFNEARERLRRELTKGSR